MKKKGNKRMTTPKQKLIHNPIPTSLFVAINILLLTLGKHAQRGLWYLSHTERFSKILRAPLLHNFGPVLQAVCKTATATYTEGLALQCFSVNKVPIIMSTVSSSTKNRKKKRCRDGVMNEFLFWCRHPLVPLLFHEGTSLHPPSFQRNDFSSCPTYFSVWGKPQFQ